MSFQDYNAMIPGQRIFLSLFFMKAIRVHQLENDVFW